MNKKKLMTFSVLGIFAMMFVTGALLSFYGQINQNVNVQQAIFVDGSPWGAVMVENLVTTNELEATDVVSGLHYISNEANINGNIIFDTECSADLPNSCDNVITIPIFKISSTDNNLIWDRVVTQDGVNIVSDIDTLSFDYELTETTLGYSPYFVLELENNDWVVSMQDTGKVINTPYSSQDENSLTFHIVSHGISGVCTQAHPCDLEGVILAVGNAKVLYVKVAVGEWNGGGETTTTALVKNIEVNGFDVINNGVVIPADSGSSVEGNVDFYIESHFPQSMIPNTYTITTTIDLA